MKFNTKQELADNNLFLSWVPREKDDGNWQFLSTTKSYQFTITVTAGEQNIILTTDLCEIAIDIKSLDISAGYKIAILSIAS
jgi:hypothetical protein